MLKLYLVFIKINKQEKYLVVTSPLTPYFCTVNRKPAPNCFFIAFKFILNLNKHMWLGAGVRQHAFKTPLCKHKRPYNSPGELVKNTINSADTGPGLNLVSVRSSHVMLMLRKMAAPTHHRALLPVRPWKPGGLTADPARVYFSLPFTWLRAL